MAETADELRWTADRESAAEASWVLWGLSAGGTFARTWTWAVVSFAGLNVGLGWLDDHTVDVEASIVGALVIALVVAAFVAACSYWSMLRSLHRELPAGTTWVALWDAESLTVRYTRVEVRLALDTIAAVRVFGFWVAIRQREDRTWRLLPRELVPAERLDRLPTVPT